MSTQGSDDSKSFVKTLEVAQAAARVREQAERANIKAQQIEQLAQQAKEDAESLSDLATNLAVIAATSSGIALGETNEQTLRAFYTQNYQSYSQMISLESFMDVISIGCHQYGIQCSQCQRLTPRSRVPCDAHPASSSSNRDSNETSSDTVVGNYKRASIASSSMGVGGSKRLLPSFESDTEGPTWATKSKEYVAEKFPTQGQVRKRYFGVNFAF